MALTKVEEFNVVTWLGLGFTPVEIACATTWSVEEIRALAGRG